VSERAANVSALLGDRAVDAPGSLALVDAGTDASRTWQQLDADVDAFARGLSSLGLVAGHRVVLALGNGICFVTSYLAVLRAGLVAVPVDPRSAADELAGAVVDSGARVVVADTATVDLVRAAVGPRSAGGGDDVPAAAQLVVQGPDPRPGELAWDDVAARGSGPLVSPVVSPADAERLAVLVYPSGTGAPPRGVMLSHRALLANIEQIGALDRPAMTRDDVVLGLIPLFHIYGLNAVLGQVLATGARLVLVQEFDAEQTLRLVAEHRMTNLPVTPPAVAAWAGRPDLSGLFASVRLLVCAASPVDPGPPAVLAGATGVTVERSYWLPETAPVVTSTLASPTAAGGTPRPAAGAGSPLPGVEVQVVDPRGDQVSGGDPGQIRVRGANLFSGYWPDAGDGPDADGWWSTGDLAVVGPDGDLVVIDRLDELVNVSGFTVYPSEVESVIGDLDEVAEAAVIGTPDELTGEAVLAFVVGASPGLAADELVDRVRTHCGLSLARFKQPTEIAVLPRLPRSVTGRVAKDRLRARPGPARSDPARSDPARSGPARAGPG
jgi:long-chain acyl-CoA synthetase